ncbi:MAG: hypothetical protein HRU78_01285 [Gammaproteobacteria bacterium]|nr:MAG: hypothetical protein HRU78_01285 [Gammaproteobacteria bacterium]
MADVIAIADTRKQDRRQDIPFFCAYHLGIKTGRRIGERRITASRKPGYVDHYAGNLVFCVVAILFLSACDAYLTLNILVKGGEELNWFMAVLIEESAGKFVACKLALTSMALILLAIHHNVRLTGKIRVRHLKYMVLAGYSTLIGYELYLLEWAVTL